MAHGVMRARTVAVQLHRVAAGRWFRRLLVLAGLLVAGWLLGGAAQAAHADELPASPPVPSDVVARVNASCDAPLRHHLVPRPEVPRGVLSRRDVPHQFVVRRDVPRDFLLAGKMPGEVREAAPEPAVVPKGRAATARPAEAAPQVLVNAGDARPAKRSAEQAHGAHVAQGGAAGWYAPARSRMTSAAVRSVPRAATHASPRVPAAPLPVPAQAGTHVSVGGLVLSGGCAGSSGPLRWDPAQPQGTFLRPPGAIPPAVRTAADEPSFAPD